MFTFLSPTPVKHYGEFNNLSYITSVPYTETCRKATMLNGIFGFNINNFQNEFFYTHKCLTFVGLILL